MAMPPAPTCEADIVDTIADALRGGTKLAIVGGGSKARVGAACAARPLPLGGIAGIVDYDPAELVLTVRPGTPLSDVQALVAGERQMLAFDPFDHGPIYGEAAGRATIGGVIAAGAAGSGRLSGGGARDHLLGFRAVSGRGEAFVAGAKVVKNVTGFDLPKLAAGSWGRLFAMTELTLKVLPSPRVTMTRIIAGLEAADAVQAMAVAMGSQAEVAAAAHIPAGLRGNEALTAFRIQGFGPSVARRCAMLEALLAPVGPVEAPGEDQAAAFWNDLRTLSPLGHDRALWRVNVPPRAACSVLAALAPLGADWMLDWAGGLIWLALDGDPDRVRQAASQAGGHATLIRADETVRAVVPAFHPADPGVAALEARVRRAFDPAGLFETGRF
jgi:glycolate oxidase FAD binding subunit